MRLVNNFPQFFPQFNELMSVIQQTIYHWQFFPGLYLFLLCAKKESQKDPYLTTGKKRFQCLPRGGQHKRHQKKTLQILWLTISSNHFRKITKIFLVTETAIIVSSRNEAEVLDSLKGESNALQSFKEMPADVTSHSLHASKSTSKNGKTFFKNIFKRLYQWRRSPA